MTRINIAYIGSSDFSIKPLIALCNDDNINTSCIITLPDRISGRRNKKTPTPVKTQALDSGHDLIEIEDLKNETFISRLNDYQLDFIVVCSFSKMIPGRILKLPRFFCINIHPSLLPEYRGAAPINRAIMDGRTITGTSFFRMNKKLDSGRLLFQKSIPIKEEDDYISMADKLSQLSGDHIPEIIKNIHNEKYQLIPQEHSRATYAQPIEKSECRLNWNLHANILNNKIRGLNGYIPAYTLYNNKRIQILKSQKADILNEDLEEGTTLIQDKKLYVKCGSNTSLEIKDLKPEGKKAMNAWDFINGYKIKSGISKFMP